MENDQLENLYYGRRVHDREDFSHLHQLSWRLQMSLVQPDPSNLSMHFVRQEYPFYGTGDYRSPAGEIRLANGSRVSDFKFRTYAIFPGKPGLPGLPATYAESEDEAETLEITLTDEVSGTDMVLSYTLFRDYPVITRHTRFTQTGDEPVMLERALSASVEFMGKRTACLYAQAGTRAPGNPGTCRNDRRSGAESVHCPHAAGDNGEDRGSLRLFAGLQWKSSGTGRGVDV